MLTLPGLCPSPHASRDRLRDCRMTGEGIEYLWSLEELLGEARNLLRGVVVPEGCTVTVEADPEARALLLAGRRVNPPGGALVVLDLDAVNADGEKLPMALREVLGRLESPLLPACGPDDVPPLELHIQTRGYRLPVRTLEQL